MSSQLHCSRCGTSVSSARTHFDCPTCEGPLDLAPVRPQTTGPALRALFDDRTTVRAVAAADASSGVWRFRELLALPGAPVSMPEGNTPLLTSDVVSRYAGVAELRIKHEGYNPTGSFKDRGMTVAITHACAVGATAVACASTGNTSASLAAYAARAGVPAFVFVPAGRVTAAKLAQTTAYGARVLALRGDFDDCLRLLRDVCQRRGVYLANSINPFRIQGQRTIVFDLLQQFGWRAPDWIAVPAGNLGNTSAFGAALRDAHDAGLIDRVPRLLAVQAAGAAPFAKAFAEGFRERHRVEAETVATAIRIGDPASWDRAVEAIRYTNGVVTAVSDADILAAKRAIDRAGIGCEPASAASVAGVRTLTAAGIIQPDDRVAAVLTGHLLKDVGGPGMEAAVEVDADAQAIEQALST